MKPWSELYAAHRGVRALQPSWSQELRGKLGRLEEAEHCAAGIRSRFTNQKDDKHAHLRRYSFRRDGSDVAESLAELEHLASAKLSLLALVDTKREHLHMFTAMAEATRHDGSSFAVAVHLPDDRESEVNVDGDRQGLGACGHAALHCHVGPDLETGPVVRVPLPAIGPVEALEWVLSQLVQSPAFEPAPWTQVQADLKKATT